MRLAGHGHTAPGLRQRGQHGLAVAVLLRHVGGGGLAVGVHHGADAVGTGEVAEQIVERPVFRVDHDDVLHLVLQRDGRLLGVVGAAATRNKGRTRQRYRREKSALKARCHHE
ncbi:hypothetical protein SDC9_146574 [bioreactor metagenome]|uniref:Uncharacterized protein n=1 Tax=bioreactor metagenome TaxID=1076179 RepID=A0A645EF38_9ZZZZ